MLRTLLVLAIALVGAYYALQASFFALLLYLWNAYFRPADWVWSGVFTTDLSFPIAAFLVASTLLRDGFRYVPRLPLIVLFLGATWLSTLTAYDSAWTWHYWVELAKVILITYLIALLTTDARKLRLLVVVIGVSVGFEAAKEGWMEMLKHPGALNTNIHPALGDNNGVAMAMMMLIPMFGALAKTAPTRYERYAHYVFLVGILFRGLSTYSRGGFLAAGAMALTYVARGERRVRLLVSICVVGALALSVMPQTFWDRMSTIMVSSEERDTSSASRLHFWRVAVLMATENPLSGVGVNGFQAAYNSYDTSGGEFGSGRAVHSTWFGLVAELGFPGLILFLLLLGLSFISCERVRKLGRTSAAVTPLVPFANALQTSFIAFVVGGTFLNAQYSELYWHLVGCTLALDAIARQAVTGDDLTRLPVSASVDTARGDSTERFKRGEVVVGSYLGRRAGEKR